MKYSFRNDYGNIGHPQVLQVLLDNANKNHVGYGFDEVSIKLENRVREILDEDVNVYPVVGGTMANLVTISKALKPYEAVIAIESGHINVHETGAIEGTGHGIITVKGCNGKVTVDDILNVMNNYLDCHMVKPGLVYISNSTEIGTIYYKEELKSLYEACHKYGLYLFLDGARLPIALTTTESDMTLKDICKYTDAFYLGGAKNGLPVGEMLVVKNKDINENFKYHIKNRGAMVNKGFFLAYMFLEYLKDDLYLKLAKNSNDMAKYLKDELIKKGVEVVYLNPTNQIFVRLENSIINSLNDKYDFEMWERGKDKSVIRLVTSWNTTKESCEELIKDI